LTEELSIHATALKKIVSYPFRYDSREEMTLHFFQVLSFTGRIKNKAFHEMAWVKPDDLHSYDLLAGDLEFLAWLNKHPCILENISS